VHSASLIRKLVASNVIERQPDKLDFTFSFDSFLAWHAERNKLSAGSIEDWAEMLKEYHYSLASLSTEEVATVIVLLEYSSASTGSSPTPQ
jgi:hypothetical protein